MDDLPHGRVIDGLAFAADGKTWSPAVYHDGLTLPDDQGSLELVLAQGLAGRKRVARRLADGLAGGGDDAVRQAGQVPLLYDQVIALQQGSGGQWAGSGDVVSIYRYLGTQENAPGLRGQATHTEMGFSPQLGSGWSEGFQSFAGGELGAWRELADGDRDIAGQAFGLQAKVVFRRIPDRIRAGRREGEGEQEGEGMEQSRHG